MTITYIHTCYRILDAERSKDFYVDKMGMKLVGEMHFDTATNYFFAKEESASEPMLELTHNHDQGEPYDWATATLTSLSLWTTWKEPFRALKSKA
jgi:lactoylglutathione lyase